MSETLKQEVERANGDSFIQWYNQENGTCFVFDQIGADPPDLLYRDGDSVLPVEITTSYYDSNDATMRWKNARNDHTAASRWSGMNPDQTLVADISNQIRQKCIGTQDAGTILVVGIYSALTTKRDFEELKVNIDVPDSVPFTQIYAGGHFPTSSDSPGGLFYFKLK